MKLRFYHIGQEIIINKTQEINKKIYCAWLGIYII